MRPDVSAQARPAMILLAPMEGLLDHSLRDVLTRVGGIDRCVSEFIRIKIGRASCRKECA